MEIDSLGLGLVSGTDDLLERGFQGEGSVDPNAVGEADPWSTGGRAIGEDEGDDLGGEQVEVAGGGRSEEGEELVKRWALSPRGDEGEDDVDGERGEGEVGVERGGRADMLCEPE